MKWIRFNLLASHYQLKKMHLYYSIGGVALLIVLLSLVFGIYWFFYKPQNKLLTIAQEQTVALQQQIESLLENAKKTPKNSEKTPVSHKPSGVISLQQPNIDVRQVLQQIAASGGINILLHESVQGVVSASFHQLSWQQALQVVLDLMGLVAEQQDEILVVRSAAVLREQQQSELKNQQENNAIVPIETLMLPIQYSQAETLSDLLIRDQQWLSPRGAVSVDERTNTLLVRDIPENLSIIQSLIQRLDIPVRQVAIEARILNVEESISKELGILWNLEGSASIGIGSFSDDMAINMQLRAAEKDNRVEDLAHPRLITADQQTAIIRQGEEIPYQQSAEYGASTISFKPAVLELQVTPHITPDDHVILKLLIKNDSRSAQALAENVPVITTKEIRTQVLVNNGETIVLGGIYTQENNHQRDKLPILGDIPGVNQLFANNLRQREKKELIVFVTPKIIG